MGTFQINGSAERKINYDVALIELTFAESDSSSHMASKIVMRECEQFLEKLEAEGIPAESIALDNDSVSENSYRDNNKMNAKRRLEIRIPFNMSVIMSLLKILFKSAFRQLSILPLIGIIAWKLGSLACLQAPKAESPSTMNNSLSELSLLLQSTNFATLFVISRELVRFFLILTLVFSASSLLLLLIRT